MITWRPWCREPLAAVDRRHPVFPGTVFHVWERLRFQNAIWHGFVLLAAGCHYSAVLLAWWQAPDRIRLGVWRI
jgi:hypothetical protein